MVNEAKGSCLTLVSEYGIEVKAGEPVKVTPYPETIIHLSQIVLGTLSPENIPQLPFDLVFEREVELSHNWKSGSVYFCGYKSQLPEEEYPSPVANCLFPLIYFLSIVVLNSVFSLKHPEEDSEDEEPFPLMNADNACQGKANVSKPVEPNKEIKAEDESDNDDESDEEEQEDSAYEEGDTDEGSKVFRKFPCNSQVVESNQLAIIIYELILHQISLRYFPS
ncbi:histone deacetylase HDT1-like [Manihot esculenta]|uniref:histone deacetylase HDT1-like n=1 Tax=Manihot esculenta TaxID=3983 RepID=UPI001CC7C5D9|nr:histone deacetylase HDT1-like [Manihot esculenta]